MALKDGEYQAAHCGTIGGLPGHGPLTSVSWYQLEVGRDGFAETVLRSGGKPFRFKTSKEALAYGAEIVWND